MNFSVSSLFAGILFSSAGLYLLKVGKSRGNLTLAIIGVTMMAYTYFTANPWLDWGIGAVLSAAAYFVW